MIAHSVSKRSAKAAPQVESTVSLSITAKLMKFTARQDFVVGRCQVKAGDTCFAVRSERRPGRYYIVKFDTGRNTYTCSCGAGACEHEHLKTTREHVMSTVVTPAAPGAGTAAPMTAPATVQEVKESKVLREVRAIIEARESAGRAFTAEEYKLIAKADRARQKAWAREYREAAAALQGVAS